MARPRSSERETVILAAAVRIFAMQGLEAPTAAIAREAGISNGSLFTYFATKSELLNRLYMTIKSEMAAAALSDISDADDDRRQLGQLWRQWLLWAYAHPDERRTLSLLNVSGEITPASREAGRRSMAEIGALIDRCRKAGAMRDAPLPLVLAIISSIAEATMDFMRSDPGAASGHSDTAFDAVWRVIG